MTSAEADGARAEDGHQHEARLSQSRHHGEPDWARVGGFDPEPRIAGLSPDATLAAMYETAAAVRLEFVYCPTLIGDLRKRWANRLGHVALSSPTAVDEIADLRNELAPYEANWDDALHLDIAQIRHALWRLRELCLHYQGFLRSSEK